MKQTVTRTVAYKGCRLHARAVPQSGSDGFNAEVVVSAAINGDHEDHAVAIKPWLHGSAEKAIRYALNGGREWVESHVIVLHGAH
jgi:hypothetical protein